MTRTSKSRTDFFDDVDVLSRTIESGVQFSTVGELAGDNRTGKPNYDWAEAAQQISRGNAKWDGGALGTAGDLTFSYLSNGQADSGYGQLSAAQIATTKKAMALWSSVANISFSPADGGGGSNISNQGEIKFQGYNGGGGGWASWSGGGGGATTQITDAKIALGGAGLALALHEIGHAVGLSHPGNYNGGGFTYERDAVFYQDSRQYTVMSYWSGEKTGAVLGRYATDENGQGVYMGGATGPGLYDIAAIQRVYGANNNTNTSDTTYGFNSNTGDDGWTLTGRADWIQAAIWDAGGNDTIDMSGYSEDAVIDLRAESFSSTGGLKHNLAIAKGVVIENAIGGSGNDVITGNDVANVINGAGGADRMIGGGGNDVYAVDNSLDQVIERAGGGHDAVYSRVDLQLAGNVETLILTRNAIQAFGDATNNQVFGNNAENVLYGQGGNDYLLGLGGDDIFVITPEAGAFDVVGDFQGAGAAGGDRMGISGFGAGAKVYQVSQTSFEIRSADNSITQQFVLQGHDGSALDAGDYYFT